MHVHWTWRLNKNSDSILERVLRLSGVSVLLGEKDRDLVAIYLHTNTYAASVALLDILGE